MVSCAITHPFRIPFCDRDIESRCKGENSVWDQVYVPVPNLALLQFLVDVGRQPVRRLRGSGGAPDGGEVAHALARGQRPRGKLRRVRVAPVVLLRFSLLKVKWDFNDKSV